MSRTPINVILMIKRIWTQYVITIEIEKLHLLSHGRIDEGVVAFLHEVSELALKDASGDAGDGVVCLGDRLPFGHPLGTDLRRKNVIGLHEAEG